MRNLLGTYINDHCIYRANPNKQYSPRLPKGKMLPPNMLNPNGTTYQFYLPRLVSDPEAFEICIEYLTLALMGVRGGIDDNFQLIGPETASAPYLVGIQQYYYNNWFKNINVCTVRKSRKPSGLYNFINGRPNDKEVVVFDDLFASGSAIHRTMKFCTDVLDLKLAKHCLSIVNNNPRETAREFKFRPHENEEISPVVLFDRDDFDTKYDKEKYWSPIDALY